MLVALENHMLPDFIADANGIKFDAIGRKHFEQRARQNSACWIQRRVDQNGFCFGAENRIEIFLREMPMRRLQRHQLGNAARQLHHR